MPPSPIGWSSLYGPMRLPGPSALDMRPVDSSSVASGPLASATWLELASVVASGFSAGLTRKLSGVS